MLLLSENPTMKNQLKSIACLFRYAGFPALSQTKTTDSLIQNIDNEAAYLVMLQTVFPRVNNESEIKGESSF